MNDCFQIRVPQMGEGLQYAKVVRILKQQGDRVEEDSDVIEVETEKAVLSISTPVAGFISGISCRPGDIVNVGAVLAEVGGQKRQSAAPGAFPCDFNQERRRDRASSPRKVPEAVTPVRALPDRQLALIRHLHASKDIVIGASIERRIGWEKIDDIKKSFRSRADVMPVPSSLGIICWAASRAMMKFDKFRSRLTADNVMTTAEESLIGVALAGEDDTLDTRTISTARDDGFRSVLQKFRAALAPDAAAAGYHSLAISDMSPFQVTSARPVVVYPAVATLFIGAPHWAVTGKSGASRCSNIVLAFDHRLINGVYAARFLREIDDNIGQLARETTPQKGEEYAKPVASYGT